MNKSFDINKLIKRFWPKIKKNEKSIVELADNFTDLTVLQVQWTHLRDN